jgi:4-amino-4-deoxy-L-arabinose transferase-like glycosyltransferase
VLAAAAVLRLAHLGATSLWLDEIYQSYLVHAPARAFWSALRFDAVHPPGDYLVGRAVEAFHPTDTAKKIPAVLWGVGSIAALALLMRRRGGPRAGLLTAVLLAAAPFHVRYSQEYRPYALGTFLVCLSLWLFDRALERPTGARRAATLLAMLAVGYTLYVGVVAAAIGAAALAGTDAWSPDPDRRANARSTLRLAPVAAAILALLYAPWWGVVRRASARMAARPARRLDLERWRLLFAFFTVSPKQEGWSFGYRPLYAAVFALTLVLIAAGTIACLRRPALRFVPLWAFGGLAVMEGMRALSPAFGPFRYSLPSGIALAGVAAAGIDEMLARRRPLLAVSAVSIIVLFQAFALGAYYRNGRYDWTRLVAFLRSQPPAETIYTSAHNPQYCLAYYLCGPGWWTDGRRCGREIRNLEGDTAPLDAQRAAGGPAWLVLDGMPASEGPRAWARDLPGALFPEAEGAVLKAVGGPSNR